MHACIGPTRGPRVCLALVPSEFVLLLDTFKCKNGGLSIAAYLFQEMVSGQRASIALWWTALNSLFSTKVAEQTSNVEMDQAMWRVVGLQKSGAVFMEDLLHQKLFVSLNDRTRQVMFEYEQHFVQYRFYLLKCACIRCGQVLEIAIDYKAQHSAVETFPSLDCRQQSRTKHYNAIPGKF